MIDDPLYLMGAAVVCSGTLIGTLELFSRYNMKKDIESKTGEKVSLLKIDAWGYLKDAWEERYEKLFGEKPKPELQQQTLERRNALSKIFANHMQDYVFWLMKEVEKQKHKKCKECEMNV